MRLFFQTVSLLNILAITQVQAVDFSWNGFATIAGGKIISSEKNNPEYLDYDCQLFP